MGANELYQYSTGDALLAGIASNGLPVADLLLHGNHGLGTFRYLVGEMIVLDGKVYQMQANGSIDVIDVADRTIIAPFAMITQFQPTASAKKAISGKPALYDAISSMFPDAHNLYLAMRVDGYFNLVTFRTVGGQSKPGEGLVEVGKHQTTHEKQNIKGTLIGFRSPKYMQGISVAGDHLHFISSDRSLGGHVLSVRADDELDIKAAPIWNIHIELPRDADFNEAKLAAERESLAGVEG